MPFLAPQIIQNAGSHFVKLTGESSKIVPTLILNCRLHALHFQTLRVARK